MTGLKQDLLRPGGSKATIKENRAAGMRCRTWLLQVLEGGVCGQNSIEGIEDKVCDK